MSAAVKEALRASHDLPKTERLVLVAVAAHANRDGDAWPSVATIADYVGCSTRTVQRALTKLVQLGRLVVRKVATIATRVYRLVAGATSGGPGVTSGAAGVTSPAAGGDTQDVTRSPEGDSEVKARGARDWRRFLPKSNHSNDSGLGGPARPPYPERRGAALPPPVGAARCPKHPGQSADHCAPCRAERLGGDL